MSGNVDGIREIAGGMTVTKRFKAASTAAGIKCRDRRDMALIHSEALCRSVSTFTSSIVKAASVKWNKNQATDNMPTHTVVIDADIANVYAGREGMGYCSQTADAAAVVLGTPTKSVLVASVEVIGKQLPTDKIKTGIEAMASLLGGGTDSGAEASKAVMTTDTRNKEVVVQFELGGVIVAMGGMCKGSGMIRPNMCAMPNFVTTNAAISREVLQEALSEDIKDTYDMASADGNTSTDDIVLLLANRLAENEEIREKGSDYRVLCKAFNYVNEASAKEVAGDDEGCTTLFEVTIVGAKTEDQAKVLVRSIITSSLAKAAIFGHDANWGGTLCATGYSGAGFDPEEMDLFFKSAADGMQIVKDGVVVDYSEEQATEILSQPQVTAVADIKVEDAQATAWECGLTSDYAKINVGYRSQVAERGCHASHVKDQNTVSKCS